VPALPVYNSSRNIQPQTAGPLQTGAEQPYIDQQKVIKTVADIAQKWSDAQDVMQSTDVKAKHGLALAQIQAEQALDKDFNNAPKYQAKIDKLNEELLKGVSNAEVRNKLSLQLNYDNEIAKIKIDADAKSQQMAYNKFQFNNYIKEQELLKSKATDIERQQINDNIETNTIMQVSTGLLTEEEALDIRYKSQKDAAESLVYSNPQAGIEALKNDYFGLLSAEDKVKLTDHAHGIEKKNKEIADYRMKQLNTQSSFDLSVALSNKTLTHDMVKNFQQSGRIDNETAAIFDSIALKKNYEIPSSTQLAQPDYFVRLIEDANGDNVKVDKVLKDAAKAYGDNKLGVNQYLYLIQQAEIAFKRQESGEVGMSRPQVIMKQSVDGLKTFANSVKTSFGNLLIKFTDRFKQGDDPIKVKQEVIEEHLGDELNKIKESLKPEGIPMISPDGRRGVIPSKNVDKALKNGYKYAQ
jgi:hypothetical protein